MLEHDAAAAAAPAGDAAAAAAPAADDGAEAMDAEGAGVEGARARLEGVAALASSIQPAGSTLATANKVLTRVRRAASAYDVRVRSPLLESLQQQLLAGQACVVSLHVLAGCMMPSAADSLRSGFTALHGCGRCPSC